MIEPELKLLPKLAASTVSAILRATRKMLDEMEDEERDAGRAHKPTCPKREQA